EGDFIPLGVENAGLAPYRLPHRRRRQVADLDLGSHGALARLQKGQNCRSGGVLQEPDQPGRAKDSRHASFGKINRMAEFNNEPLFADRSDLGKTSHPSCPVLSRDNHRFIGASNSSAAWSASCQSVADRDFVRKGISWPAGLAAP